MFLARDSGDRQHLLMYDFIAVCDYAKIDWARRRTFVRKVLRIGGDCEKVLDELLVNCLFSLLVYVLL